MVSYFVRNSIILVDFIELRRSQGMSLEEAVVDAGAVRFRPMLLTAAAVVVGASVILFDPIFQGLALSLMAGEVASTVLSRMPNGTQHKRRIDSCRLTQPGWLCGDDPQRGGRRRTGCRERRGSTSDANFCAETAPRLARRNGDQGEHRLLRRLLGRIYEGYSRMRPQEKSRS